MFSGFFPKTGLELYFYTNTFYSKSLKLIRIGTYLFPPVVSLISRRSCGASRHHLNLYIGICSSISIGRYIIKERLTWQVGRVVG